MSSSFRVVKAHAVLQGAVGINLGGYAQAKFSALLVGGLLNLLRCSAGECKHVFSQSKIELVLAFGF
jgi:hypothetical protein